MSRICEKYRELTSYAHTTFIKYDPPHFEEWQCPKHPDAKAIHIDEHMPRSNCL